MAARPGLPPTVRRQAERALAAFCEARVPPQHRAQVRLEFAFRGSAATIFECRPPWRPEDAGRPWTRMPVVQLRYGAGRWRLYWADGRNRWHPDPAADAAGDPYIGVSVAQSPDIETLLGQVTRDPTGAFSG